MRIRKRFPKSSLSSDPLVQLQSSNHSQPSDHPNEKSRLVHHKDFVGDDVKDERWSEEEKNNHIIRKSSNLGLDSSIQILPPSDSDQVVERWYEGKDIPVKKRIMRDETKREDKIRMKSKTNKKCARLYSNNFNDNPEEGSEKNKINFNTRCSRVNGRGWRCGQKTLVGYCLCEHHLEKGRLRKKKYCEIESEPLMMDDDDEGVLMVRKNRIGVVKARSIRSLLGQTDPSTSTNVRT